MLKYVFNYRNAARITFILFSISIGANSFAGPLDSFMKFTSGNGSMTSINKGAVISDQRAGYITGGSIISRGPRPRDLTPLNAQLPSMDYDPCTGSWDLRFGGFSYIKGPEFAEYFKSMATGSGTYLAKMAIKQTCNVCENVMSDLEAIARDINGMSFSQCEQSKAIASGLLGKYNAATNQKCLMKSSIAKGGSDLHEASQKCGDNPDRYGERGDEVELKSLLPDNFNLVWRALSHGNGEAPSGMKELIMSISGSIIGTKANGVPSFKTLPSLVEKQDLLEQYIGRPGAGSSAVKLYVCDDAGKCLNPTIIERQMNNRADTLYGKIESNLLSILDKIADNAGELSDEEQALVEYSQIPIITLFETELALKNKDSVALLAGSSEFIEVICYDTVVNFMQKMLHEAKEAVGTLQAAQLDNTHLERFNKNIESVQLLLRDKKHLALEKLQTIVAIKERLSRQQDVFELSFVRYANSRGM